MLIYILIYEIIIYAVVFTLENGLFNINFQVEGAIFYTRALILFVNATFLLLFLFSNQGFILSKTIKNLSFFIVFVFIFSNVSSIFNLSNIKHTDYFTHIVNYINFYIALLLAFQVNFKKKSLINHIQKISIILLAISSLVLVYVYLNIRPSSRVSIALYSILFPLAYFSASLQNRFFIYTFIVSLLTLKRSFIVSAVLMNFVGKSTTYYFKFILFIVVFVVFFTIVFSHFYEDLFEMVLGRIFIVESDYQQSFLDRISSGRVADFLAVIYSLYDSDKLLTGFGFGGAYDSQKYTFGLNEEWIKSGSDVIFSHFFLIHGIVVGSIIIILLIVFVHRYARITSKSNDVYCKFIFNLLFLYLLVSMFTFIPSDPLFGIVIGLLLRCDYNNKLQQIKI